MRGVGGGIFCGPFSSSLLLLLLVVPFLFFSSSPLRLRPPRLPFVLVPRGTAQRGGGDGTRVKGRKGGLRREEELEEGSTNSPLAPSQTVWYRVVPLLTKGRPET